MKTTSNEETPQKTLELLRARAEAILADRRDIHQRWTDKASGTPYCSSSLTAWRNAILKTEKDLGEISARIQTICELFPNLK